ncbi:MAG: hypothetical protein M1823_003067 [Watsoniomyces obsoletus]|nr:MAG: hypothetical protein M1823_003067 [Watsoniomyces obsoletus]
MSKPPPERQLNNGHVEGQATGAPRIMAMRRRHLIISGIAGFIAWSLAADWFPTLRYIGYAFVAGTISTVIALTLSILLAVRRNTYDQDGPASRIRSAAFVAPEHWSKEVAALAEGSHYRPAPLFPQSIAVSEGLDKLLTLIERDFILSWYTRISGHDSFVNEVDKLLRAVVENIRDRIAEVDLVQTTVARLVPIFTDHLNEFDQAEKLVRGKNLERSVTEAEDLDLAIAAKYRSGKLHPAVPLLSPEADVAQQKHVQAIVERLLQEVIPRSQSKSHVVMVLLREIVSRAVLLPLLQILADPDTWNQLIEAYGRTVLQDRKSVRRLRAALDQHASPNPKSGRGALFPRLTARDSERNYERFIRAIRACNNLPDARRFRSQIASQLRREAAVEGQDPLYLRRLEVGKQILDRKIATLVTGESPSRSRGLARGGSGMTATRLEQMTLTEILRDPTGLSYFMEFMDRRRLMTLVQFWLVVEGIRNPLEDDPIEEEEESGSGSLAWSEADRNDLVQIDLAYLSRPELNVAQDLREAVSVFLANGVTATSTEYYHARKAVLRAQTDVLGRMQEQDFPEFKRSDLFFKYLTSDEVADKRGSRMASPTPPSGESSSRRPSAILRKSTTFATRLGRLKKISASSSDVRLAAANEESAMAARRSLDDTQPLPHLDGAHDVDPLSNSIQSLDTDIDSGVDSDRPDREIVRAMEAALTDIIEEKPGVMDGSRIGWLDSSNASLQSPGDNGTTVDFLDAHAQEHKQKYSEKPSIASLGLVNTSSRIGVFTDNDLFSDEEKFVEDEHEDPEETLDEKAQEHSVQEAGPGDLGLNEAIAILDSDIDKLVAQDVVVDSLTLKAELTNNAAELRILRKSKASLQREIRRKELQRQQYILQERDNKLYGRATIRIKSVMVGTEDDGHEYAIYMVEVSRHAGEQMPAASWAVARRYSEFHELHRRLRTQYPNVRRLDFPRRRVMMKLQQDFLDKRRLALEHYLRELLLLPDVCRSRDLRAFLSQQAIASPNQPDSSSNISSNNNNPNDEPRDIITRLYDSFTTGVDDILGNIPVLDQLSVAGQNLMAAATQQMNSMPSSTSTSNISDDPLSAAEAEAELQAFESSTNINTNTNTNKTQTPSQLQIQQIQQQKQPFVKPICDIFLEIFELNRGNNWLRGRAVVVILHQLLGGTIERKIRDTFRLVTSEENIVRYLEMIQGLLWPGGKFLAGKMERSPAEKARSKKEAGLVLATLLHELAGGVVGRANAQAAGRKVAVGGNNRVLNTHLVFTIFDELIDVLFGFDIINPGSGPPGSARIR